MAPRKDPLDECIGFDWDDGNTQRNRELHRVMPAEAEAVFFNVPLVVRSDERHSGGERRYYALGQFFADRRLFLAFGIRRRLIRVISVRDMNRKEELVYAGHEKNNS
jgi:uncharacterized protein